MPLIAQRPRDRACTHACGTTADANGCLAQLAANETQAKQSAKHQTSLQLCGADGAPGDFQIIWADLICRRRKTATICAQLHPWTRARPRVQGYSVQGDLLLHLKSQIVCISYHKDKPQSDVATCVWSSFKLLELNKKLSLE